MADGTYTSPADEALFAAMGRLAISWAHIELGIDVTIAIVYHSLGGNEIEEKPWSLNRKIRFLRKCYAKLEALESLREIGILLLDEIKEASTARHDIIHGFILEHPEGGNEIKMARLLRGGAPNARKEYSLTTDEILRKAVEAAKLAHRATGIAAILIEARRKLLEMKDQAGREIGG